MAARSTRQPLGSGSATTAGAIAASLGVLIAWVFVQRARFANGGGRWDFSTYYAAAYALRQDIHANIYDAAVLARAASAAHTYISPPLPYTYPPLFAVLLSPFTVVSFGNLAVLWLACNDILWLVVTVILAREIAIVLRDRQRRINATATMPPRIEAGRRLRVGDPVPFIALALAMAICLPSEPGNQTLGNGQVNFVVLLPLVQIPALLRRRHEHTAGAMVAIAAMLKITPALLLVYFAVRGRWRVVFAALVGVAALLVVCLLVVGPDVTAASAHQIMQVGGKDAINGHNEALLAPLVNVLVSAMPGNRALLHDVQYTVLAEIAIGIGLVLFRWRQPTKDIVVDREKDVAAFGMSLCVTLLVAPTAWVHHYVWALPAAAIAAGIVVSRVLTLPPNASRQRLRVTGLALLTALCCVLLVVTLPFDWDVRSVNIVPTLDGLPVRALFLTFRALGTLGLLCLLGYWYIAARPEIATRDT